jgi:hypothetical protein
MRQNYRISAPNNWYLKVMHEYQIRILRSAGQPLVVSTRLMGDHAAIRKAQSLAMSGDQLEVWRGMVCVYSTAESAIPL